MCAIESKCRIFKMSQVIDLSLVTADLAMAHLQKNKVMIPGSGVVFLMRSGDESQFSSVWWS